jgi:hypothetical protein
MRSGILYPLLVGLPVAGVLAILRAGERLTPLTSIGGVWAVDTASLAADARVLTFACGSGREAHAVHGAAVAQSGTASTIALRDGAGRSWAEGTLALAAGRSAAEGMLTRPACASDRVRVTLRPEAGRRPGRALLVLRPAGCAGCAEVRVPVTRAAPGELGDGAGH